MEMARLYVDSLGRRDPLVEMQSPTLVMFIAQTAACLLAATIGYPRDDTEPLDDPIGSILVSRMDWAPHGFTNALLSQAALLYAVVDASVKMGMPIPTFFDRKIALLITDALAAFQEWKTDLIQAQKEEFGEQWGDATSSNQMDWTDQTAKFLRFWAH